jgi:hypothetical protein
MPLAAGWRWSLDHFGHELDGVIVHWMSLVAECRWLLDGVGHWITSVTNWMG